MFEHIKQEADKLRVLENNILSDYKNRLNVNEIKLKYNCTTKFVKRTIECYRNNSRNLP